MSRVHKSGEYMNTVTYPPEVTNTSKMVRIHHEDEDYHKARTLSAWLFMKYDMTYRSFRTKSKKRKDKLRAEFIEDTRIN